MHYLVWVLISAVFVSIADYFSKKYAISRSLLFLALFIGMDMIGVVAWLPAIVQKNSLSIAGSIWAIMNFMGCVLIGVFIFNEKLNILEMIGMVTAIASIVLLSL